MSALGLLFAFLLVVAACSGNDPDGAEGRDEPRRGADSTTTTQPAPLERYAGYVSRNYADPAHWLCRPDTPDDPCHGDLDATSVAADGTLTVEPFEAAADPPVDCFYVYPTISKDPEPFSDWDASDDEEGYAALNQVGRLRSVCRVFAPIYRQRTLAGLTAAFGGEDLDAQGDPFADVLDAWKTYMATDNAGRGVVLVGHSQGSGMLGRLLESEFDPNPDVRDILVGAYIPGLGLRVPEGELVGGQLQNIPVCSTTPEVGCVSSWATFRATAPPEEGALFGTVRGGGAEGEAACVNPAAPGGGSAELHAYLPANPKASILASLGTSGSVKGWVEGAEITTPFVTLPGLLTGECVRVNGYHFLSLTVHPDPGPRADDITGDLSPQWGLHLVDMSVVMGDVVERVAEQVEVFTR